MIGRALAATAIMLIMAGTAHAEITIDGSTKETYERSIKEMAEALSEEEREVFAQGLLNLMITGYPPAQGTEGMETLALWSQAAEAAHITLDGVTLSQIMERGRAVMEEAEKKKAERETEARRVEAEEARTREQAEAEKLAADALRRCLQENVVLAKPAIVEPDNWPGHYMSIDVTNNLPWAMSGVWVDYTIITEGRSVPWEVDEVWWKIEGGLEPGETRTLTNDIHISRHVPDPDDLTLTAEVTDVRDASEKWMIGRGSDERSTQSCE